MNYEERDTYGMYTAEPHGMHGPALMGADTLIGNAVYNQNGDDLGDLKEIMVDMRSGQVSYGVLSLGGFLGMGGKLFAVPWAALRLDSVNKRFTLTVDREQLENAPGFAKDHWPNMTDASWAKGIHDYYGTTPRRP